MFLLERLGCPGFQHGQAFYIGLGGELEREFANGASSPPDKYGVFVAVAVDEELVRSGQIGESSFCISRQAQHGKKFEWGVVGETACADSWGRALKTGEPSLSLPCFAERRYGGVPDEEMLMALQPAHLAKAIVGMKQLAKNGLRYPIAPYGIQADVRAGMGVSYAKK